MGKTDIYEKTLTPRSVIISIISVVLIVTIQMSMESVGERWTVRFTMECTNWPNNIYGANSALGGVLDSVLSYLLVPVAISLLLPKRWRPSMQELAFVYAAIGPVPLIAAMYSGVGHQLILNYVTFHLAGEMGKFAREYTSPLLGPKEDFLLDPMYKGGAIVPWNAWTVTLVYFGVFYISLFLFAVFGASIMRKSLVKIEALHYPIAQVVGSCISLLNPERKGHPFKSKLFVIGLLLGFAFNAIHSLDWTYWPGVFGEYPELSMLQMSYDITNQLDIRTPLALGICLHIPALGWGLLLSRDILLSAVMGYFALFVIIPQIFVVTGDIGMMASRRDFWHNWQKIWNTNLDCAANYPTSITHMGYIPWISGMLFALAALPIIYHWRDLFSSFKTAIGKAIGKKSTTFAEEASIDLISWFGWIGSGILSIVMFTVGGLPIEWSLFIVVMLGLTWLGMTRLTAETGLPLYGMTACRFGGLEFSPCQLLNSVIVLSGTCSEPTAAAAMGRLGLDCFNGGIQRMQLNPGSWNMDSYKVGELTKSRNKDLLISQIIGVVLSVCIALPTALYLWYHTGWFNGLSIWVQQREFSRGYNMSTYGGKTPVQWYNHPCMFINEWSIATFIAAVAMTLGIYYMRGRVGGLWTWISPAGILYACISNPMFYWLSFVIALALKEIVTKVGGVKLYQRKIVPIAMGIVIGSILNFIPSMFALYLRGLGFKWW